MIYRLLLTVIKWIDNDLVYCFAYWWVRFYCFLKNFILPVAFLPSHPVDTMDLHFHNPVGLAAGFDRDGKLVPNLGVTGFGFVEIGTINIDSQNETGDELAEIIRDLRYSNRQSESQPLLGVSLGSLKNITDKHIAADYLHGMKTYWHCSDYLVINLSRTNSSVRSEKYNNIELRNLLKIIKQGHIELCAINGKHVPAIVKVAIECENRKKLPETLTITHELEFDGLLVAFENWTLFDDVVDTVRKISALTNQLPLIAVGGIKSADDVLKILNAGANLVQCYTLLVEQGPKEIENLIRKLPLPVREP